MAYREVTRMEMKEVLRQWVVGAGCKRISARLGLDVKTVRRYVHAAQAMGLTRTSGETALTDELLTTLLASLRTQAGRPHDLAESFFASLECEVLDRNHFRTHEEARTAVFSWIEGWSPIVAILPWGISHQRSLNMNSLPNLSPEAPSFCRIRVRRHGV